ncbi:ABC transporter substrate-binding protein [Acidisphaera sp. L21]|uniref:ABC transporter substrate-binding protein n=1 Tax=Acidisphaera sp. L21 TaxID=1641851 RepID=UPI00131DFEA4|nr:ABC transporter substrate-binding protein [Acidisphaera sp. L21]
MMHHPTRRTLLGGAFGAAIAGLPGHGHAADAAGTPGNTLKIGMAAPFTTLDPHLQSNAPNNAMANHIFDALITNDETSRSTPGLAQSWRLIDDTHWELTLRPNVTFTDGTPFTAQDAIVSLNRATTLPSMASFRTYTRSIKAMTAPDPHTLVIETTRPDPLLLNSLSRIHIIAAKFKDAPTEDFNSGRAAIGTGPFVFQTYVPGSHLILTRNDAWWGAKQPWATVHLQIATDRGARLASLLSGDRDIIEAVPTEAEARVRTDPKLNLISGVSSRLVYLAMDQHNDIAQYVTGRDGKPLDRNPLKDLRVRQALDMAINRQAIVDRVMQGNAVAASQFLPPGGRGNAPDVQPTRYDPEKAKALLAQAGYPNGFGITLHGPNDRYINDGKIVQAVAQMFSRIGIETRAEVMPWSVYASKSGTNNFSVMLSSWGVNTGETSNPLSSLVATQDRSAGFGEANEGRYTNPALDTKLKQALGIMDDDKRNQMLGQACSLAFHDTAILPLHHEKSVLAARKGLTYATRADQYTLAMGVGRA